MAGGEVTDTPIGPIDIELEQLRPVDPIASILSKIDGRIDGRLEAHRADLNEYLQSRDDAINDALTNAPGGYHRMCMGANALGGGLLSYDALGGASPLPFQIMVNGNPVFPITGIIPSPWALTTTVALNIARSAAMSESATLAAAAWTLSPSVMPVGQARPGRGPTVAVAVRVIRKAKNS